MSRKYTTQDRLRLIVVYREWGSIRRAADAVGVGHSWAYKTLRAAGEIKVPTPVFPVRLVPIALRLYASGMSCRDVAAELAKIHTSPAPSQQWVFVHVQRAGILRSKSRAMELREAERHGKDFDRIRRTARRLAAERLWSVKRIARVLGVTTKTVARALPRALRCNPSLATLRRQWQAYLPDVEQRRARRDRVIALRERGRTYPQIRAATGLSISTIHRYLHEAGLTGVSRRRPAARASASR